MFSFINFFAAAESSGDFNEFYNRWLNYPGFEAWKFLNLLIFVGVLVYLLKKPLSNAFKAKRETIRQELIRAKAERDEALAKLAQVEARISNLAAESTQIEEQAACEADAEAARIAAQTNFDVEKLRDNARREIEAAGIQARRELKRFSANESIKLAEEMLRQNLKGDDASRLVNASISNLGNNNIGAASSSSNGGGLRQ